MRLNNLTKIFLIFMVSLGIFGTISAKIQNKIIIKIENKIITEFDVRNKILSTLVLANAEINQKNINEQKKRALELLILHKLKQIELDKYNIKKNDAKIAKYLNSTFSNDIENLKVKFKNNAIDFDLFLEEIETQVKWQELIYTKYAKKIQIDEKSINEEVQKLSNDKFKSEEFKISEIEILDNKDNYTQKTIFNIKDEIKNLGFEKTAQKYSISESSSNNGNLGWVDGNLLSKKIYNIISKLEIGGVSEPIRRQNTILFLKLNEKRALKKEIDLVKLKKNLINRKKNELFALYSQSYLSKLRNTNLIEYK